MAGPWQHYLPAAYLAGFATVAAPRPRETPLWIGRRGKQPYQQTAERVGAERDIYTLAAPTTFDPGLVDAVWGGTEGYFQIAIERLITSRSISSSVSGALVAELWAKVLVPFVTQFFVRGPDFAPRQRHRMGEQLYAVLSKWPNHHNYARMLEYQRLLTVISSSEWMVSKPFTKGV